MVSHDHVEDREGLVFSKPLHLIFDAQLFQSSDRYRGMGRYALSLIDALDVSALHCTFIVNPHLPALDIESRRILERQGSIVEVPLLHRKLGIGFGQAKESNRRAVTEAVATLGAERDVDKVVFVIPSLFCGEIHPVFPSEGTTNVLVFYDLIPYLFPGLYLHGGEASEYSARFGEFYRADHYACDSQSAADDLVVHLGVDPSRTTAVLGASAIPPEVVPTRPAAARDLGRFALVASGNDPRKNNEAAVHAFARLGPDVTPVFTSKYPVEIQNHLRSICPQALFTGHLSDAELLWLIDHAEFVFFPSVYEGLGLPILEAVERRVPVVCSRIPAFTEISETAFRFFDPYSLGSMVEALEGAASSPRDPTTLRPDGYGEIAERFNWPACGRRFLRAASKAEAAERVGRLAIVAPSPAGFSAVGKYAFQTYAELSRHFDIDYFGEAGLPPHPPVRFNLLEHGGHYFPASAFLERASDYEHIVYHFGNSDFHASAAISAFQFPGIGVIHDTYLDGIVGSAVNAGMVPSLLGVQVSTVDAALGLTRSRCLAWLVAKQKAVTTFSRFAGEAVDEMPFEGASLAQTVHPIGVPVRRGHGSSPCTVGFPGIVGASKGLDLAAQIAAIPGVTVKVFGFDPWGMRGAVPEHDNIRFLGNLSDLQFDRELQATDIVVNFRASYHGETSRSTLEAMAVGVAVVVRRVGWFAELPDDVVVKVDAEEEVGPAVRALAEDPARRERIGAAARAFLTAEYGYADSAKRFASIVRDASAAQPPALSLPAMTARDVA